MLSSGWVSPPRWLTWLSLCILTHLHLATAQTAVSSLILPDTNTIVSINLPPNSDDINFYVSTPNFYQYTAIAFGAAMPDALMLVMYASADAKGVTVSPRTTSGHTEPVHDPSIRLALHSSTITDNQDMIVNATCLGCRRHPVPVTAASPMLFAIGPSLELSSDDPDARIRRHTGYAHFTIDLLRATGPGGIGTDAVSGNITSSGATLGPDGLQRDGGSKAATAHGILYAITALAVAPFDSLVAGALGKKWAWMHGVTATVYFAFVIGAMVPGVIVGGEHVATQKLRTPHQAIGLLTVVAMTIMFAWGIWLSWIKRSAKARGQEPPASTRTLAAVHRWACRLIWALLLVSVGLGMKLSEQRTVLILAYVALALGLIVILVPVYFCMWRCSKRRQDKDEGHELTIYDQNYQNYQH
ncbi:hypothetical protein C8A05DRAFT_38837 [Staphylotrichum tortipilum]|uniref:Cellobiose dehydrogenase-like cytochrome domain-containing protein n=1 Tax=Staphylotrichum tortipilum TaxID=2831512 RepID=A0AAN6RPF1_9PEZI|nr:hypothetical protein C8A05DRAFT_38837 [Staphylotrichum longicolle]